ncbi:MAG: uL15 family ribosomal protein, partial [Candidatus Pacebacteria bacterium]|nr:uL15 family ribosomal protein [Candidatus Paceibacterota bacterium]
QKGRSGAKFKPLIRDWVKKYPKLRGYRFMPLSVVCAVNLNSLEAKFNVGEIVNPITLAEKKIVRRIDGKVAEVKILSKGEIKKALTIEGCYISKLAKEKIEKAGGTVKEKVKKVKVKKDHSKKTKAKKK